MLSHRMRDVIILPKGVNRASKSGCVMDFGRPDTYRLAPLIDSELGLASETLMTLFCSRSPFSVLIAFSASSGFT